MTRVRLLPHVAGGTVLGLGLAGLAGVGSSAWRAPVVGAAAGLLVAGLRRLVGLARDEWRRRAPSGRAYAAAVWPLAAALVLAAIATT